MNTQTPIEFEAFVREITRYLAAVDLFRAESCEPTWLPESAPRWTVPERLGAFTEHTTSAP